MNKLDGPMNENYYTDIILYRYPPAIDLYPYTSIQEKYYYSL